MARSDLLSSKDDQFAAQLQTFKTNVRLKKKPRCLGKNQRGFVKLHDKLVDLWT